MKNPFTVRNMPYIAILLAVEIVLQFIGNHIQLGPVSINLSLVPITLGAIIFGPWVGLFLGIFNAVFVLLAPSTIIFYNITIWGTIVTCLSKSMLAGFIGGLVYLLINRWNNFVATIVTSVLIPVLNTGIFAICALIFFRPILVENVGTYSNIYQFLLIGMIGWNFIFELSFSIILVFPIYRIIVYYQRKRLVASN